MTWMEIYWLNHAAFKIKLDDGTVIYIDPYELKSDDEKGNIIISTHGHFDHFSAKDIKKVYQDGAIVLGPSSINKELKKFNGKGLDLGKTEEIGSVKITLVPAYTIRKGTHPKGNNWAGVIIKYGDFSVYHAGDTERIPEMKDLASENITVALLPCGGTYTMDFDESTDAAVDIKPKYVIPMHNWGKDLTTFKEILAKKDPNIETVILKERGSPFKLE